jgi:uncharacterized protein involved in exopolysaccharide biosynthesis
MGENKEDYRSLQNMIDASRTFLNYLLRKWWVLGLFMLTGAGLGAMYYFMQKPKYVAESTFILEEKSSGNSGLAGLASQFGFNVGNLTGGGMFSGDNILTILESKKVVQEVLLSEVDSSSTNGKSLADYYLEFTGMKKKWEKKSTLANIHFANQNNQITPLQDSLLNVMYENIINKNLETGRTNKQSSIISVKVTAADGTFARLLSERLVDATARLYMEVRVGTAQRNIVELQKRSDSLLFLLNNKSYSSAASQPLDINPGLRTATVPVEIATRDKTVLATLYAEVVKNLEASKLILSQQTPVVQLLDRPGYLLEDKRKGLAFLLVVMSSIMGFLYVAATAVFFLYFKIGVKVNSSSGKVQQ